ncbi:molybdopterin adenylyltransferase [Roseiterribacter gracilis]|uniref:Molybdopterin adenylyltransferase n=1 Tax=Roseiterribacter gracilis TaxID=2812848 RepID=A0A8S8XKN7_9PROT|nr:molybdopterin adenylyltransferase [Rhodospirillales bacterium TMPK1]
MIAKIGVLTASDRAHAGVYDDASGQAIRDCLAEWLTTKHEIVYRLVPDERATIEAALIELVDKEGCCLVVTTGGTGPARRDVTVEATLAVCHKPMPGFGELMRAVSLKSVPTAILSRQEAGIRYAGAQESDGGALLVNLPGSPRAIRECLEAVMPAIPYCVELIGGPYLETDPAVLVAFRPKKK